MKTSLFYACMVCLALSSFAPPQTAPPPNTPANANTIAFNIKEGEYNQLQLELKQLDVQKKQVLDQLKAYDEKQKMVLAKVLALEKFYNDLVASGKPGSQLSEATMNMQEMQQSFNLQYLQLQSSMQNENRQFTMVSNIMKTKHDTVKNSIGNIR
jgi:hypothetical protein